MVLDYLAGVPEGELDRMTTSPTLGDTRTVRQRLVGVLAEGLQHAGQMAYLRGIFDGPDAGKGVGGAS
jgi:hypothetical protein